MAGDGDMGIGGPACNDPVAMKMYRCDYGMGTSWISWLLVHVPDSDDEVRLTPRPTLKPNRSIA